MTSTVPRTLEQALDTAWLSTVLTPVSGGAGVVDVEVTELIQVNATKVRFAARFEDGSSGDYCLKAFLDQPELARGNPTSVREADFYRDLAGQITVRVPVCVAAPVDREGQFGIVVMRDLVAEGAHFCTALEPMDTARVARSLEQLARLHTAQLQLGPVSNITWTPRQIERLSGYLTAETIQDLVDGPRSDGLPRDICDAARLLRALRALATIDATRPTVLVHGDCHAGNIFETEEGTGLIDWQLLQRGSWSLDVAYHIASTLTVDIAEREERALLRHYLDTVKSLGGEVPDDETAWLEYRMAPVYGYFLWSITRFVDPAVVNTFFNRLGNAVQRHDSFSLLEEA